MTRKISVALIQMNCRRTKDHNKNKAELLKWALDEMKKAVDKGAKIVCLPENFSSFYFCDAVDHKFNSLAEPVPGPTIEAIQKFAKEKSVVIVVPLWEEAMPGIFYNTACVVDADGSIMGLYRKNHLPQAAGQQEKFYYKPGNLGYPVFRTKYADLGVLLGYDRFFPEAYRILALNGAEIVFLPTGESDTAKERFETPVIAGALDNGIYCCLVNRVGKEEKREFLGGSFVVAPNGVVVARSKNKKEETVRAELDLEQIPEERKRHPYFRDRRPETYGDLIEQLP